jgi:hypothetical protein
MNLKKLLQLSLFLALSISNVYAKDSYISASIAMVGMNMDYTEYSSNGTAIDSEESSFSDITGVDMSLGYIYKSDSISYNEVKLNLLILGGQTYYRGSYLGSDDPIGTVTRYNTSTIIDTDISFVKTSDYNDYLKLSFGIGLGYRQWERELSALQIEVYKWFYFKPIIGFNFSITKKLGIDFIVEYQHGFNTVMTSTNPNLDFTLGGANIWELTIPITYELNEHLEFFFKASFTKQTISKSNNNSGYYEPDSTAYNNYIKIGTEFKF